MNILITGANGTIAKQLTLLLNNTTHNLSFLTANLTNKNEQKKFLWNLSKNYLDEKSLENVDIIVHLAGAGIADKRWSKKRKQELIDSRVKSLHLIHEHLERKNQKIKKLICASATGYYPNFSINNDEIAQPGLSFISNLCVQWEQAAIDFKPLCENIAIVRTGLVLDKYNGYIKKLIPMARLGLLTNLGSPKIQIPWIYINDIVKIYAYLIEHLQISGVYNAVANHAAQDEITKSLLKTYDNKKILPNIPAYLLPFFLGQRHQVITHSCSVNNNKIKQTGFCFDIVDLASALKYIA